MWLYYPSYRIRIMPATRRIKPVTIQTICGDKPPAPDRHTLFPAYAWLPAAFRTACFLRYSAIFPVFPEIPSTSRRNTPSTMF